MHASRVLPALYIAHGPPIFPSGCPQLAHNSCIYVAEDVHMLPPWQLTLANTKLDAKCSIALHENQSLKAEIEDFPARLDRQQRQFDLEKTRIEMESAKVKRAGAEWQWSGRGQGFCRGSVDGTIR